MLKNTSKPQCFLLLGFFVSTQDVVTNVNNPLAFPQTTLTLSPGSLDVPQDVDEAGEPAYAKQRPLGTGFRPSPPRQEAPAAALRNLGRQRVTGTRAAVWLPKPVQKAGVQ